MNPAPDAGRRIIHELAGQLAVLRSECGRIQPAIGLGRQALQRASETLREKAAQSDAAAATATEDVLKQQQLSLSRQYASAAETMSKLCKEWEAAAKKLDRGATFLAQAASVTLQWEKLTDVMPAIAPDENSPAISQAKTIARAVALRFDLLPRLKEGLPRLKAALSILGYSESAAFHVPMPEPLATQPARALTWNRGATQGESPASGSSPGFSGIRRLSTVEELTRTGWLTVNPPN